MEIRYANAMSEVLEYLKGIKDEDVKKISSKFLNFLEENASKDFVCNFDYNKPLAELEISKEAKSIIGLIYYNFWCENEQQKKDFLLILDENEKVYQKELNEIYNTDNLFKVTKNQEQDDVTISSITVQENKNDLKWYERFFKFIKNLFKK